jgi:hypothetical protein
MAIKADSRARSPRGTKILTQAFFEALDGIPGAQQKAVATAALAGIRDELKAQRLKAKETASKAKAKARTPARTKAAPARKAKGAATARRAPVAASRKATTTKTAARKVTAKKTTAPKAAKAKAKTNGRSVEVLPAAAAE